MINSYYPELGESKPEAQIESRISHYGNHWLLSTPLTLSGRGVKLLQVRQLNDQYPANHACNRRVGWNDYKVTDAAFKKISQQYTVSHEILLD